MDSKHKGWEAFVIALALSIFVLYHVWFFCLKAGWCVRKEGGTYYGINGKGKLARIMFSYMVSSNDKAAVLGIQQNRNAMMGASFQSSIAALFFNELLEILLTPSKMQTLHRFSRSDPLLSEPAEALQLGDTTQVGIVSAQAVIVVNLAVILVAMMFFVVCVRLNIHTGYYYRAASHSSSVITISDAVKLTLQAQVVYTVGQRLIFFFPITVMWLLGPTSMLCTSVVITSAIFGLDQWNPKNPERHTRGVLHNRVLSASEHEGVDGMPSLAAVQSDCRSTAAADPAGPVPSIVVHGNALAERTPSDSTSSQVAHLP